jgi:hypothetical protein
MVDYSNFPEPLPEIINFIPSKIELLSSTIGVPYGKSKK